MLHRSAWTRGRYSPKTYRNSAKRFEQ